MNRNLKSIISYTLAMTIAFLTVFSMTGCDLQSESDTSAPAIEVITPTEATDAPTEPSSGATQAPSESAEPTEPVHVHNYTEVVTNPNCTEGGYTTFTCECGDTYQADHTEAIGHGYETAVTPATCTEHGYTVYTCHCGHSYTGDEVDAAGHSYTGDVTAPSCVDQGYTTYTCAACGDTYQADQTDATGHSYSKKVIAPTCTTQGYATYTCTTCGYTYTADQTAATGHSYSKKVTAPTCTAQGYITYTCTGCGDTYQADQTDATGHSYSKKVTAPTCTAQGYTTYSCAACGDTYQADQTDATGHSYSQKVTAPTCTTQGYTTYTCTGCGDSYTGNRTSATGHSWGSWSVTKAPTTTSEGTEQRSCKNCGKIETRSVDKLTAYETFGEAIGVYNAHNQPYTDWKGDTQQAAFIEVYSVTKDDSVMDNLVAEFEKAYGYTPSLGNEYRCKTTCEKLGTYLVEGYDEPQTVYHYTITDKTYIYITNEMYTVYVQECADGSIWVGFCVYATMDTLDEENRKEEVQALRAEMYATFAELIGVSENELYKYKDELGLWLGCISEAGTVRSVHSDVPVDVLYIFCRGFALGDAGE